MTPIKSWYCLCVLLLAMCALVHCALEPVPATDQFADNPDEKNEDTQTPHKRPSFFVGSRYGRSGGGGGGGSASLFASSKTRRLNVVPRNDRFFLGSRYGKRASEYMAPYEQENGDLTPSQTPRIGNNKSNTDPNASYMMSCIYTGFNNLYRCNSIEEINNIINQLTTAHGDDERK